MIVDNSWYNTGGKTEVLGEKPFPVPRCSPHSTWTGGLLNPSLRGKGQATKRLYRDTPTGCLLKHKIVR